MAMELGCLLGAYGGPQSFEAVGSWALQSAQSSFSVGAGSQVHSSAKRGALEVWSSAGGQVPALRYDYGAADDAFARWSADVTTHRIVVHAWAAHAIAANSGQAFARLAQVDSAPIPYAALPQALRLEANVVSGDPVQLDWMRWDIAGSGGLYLDDVLAAVDVLTLNPADGVREGMRQRAARHLTPGGVYRQYLWHNVPTWEIPLHAVPSSAADLINGWWREARDLAFTFDSSDTEQTWAVRLINGEAPFSQFELPHWDRQRGTLRLQALGGGLSF